jgi:hypothetical protein
MKNPRTHASILDNPMIESECLAGITVTQFVDQKGFDLKEDMKSLLFLMTAVSLGLTATGFADNYSDLAAQGYRWVVVNGPYACITEQDVERITTHHTDATELQVVESIECYYLIPGTIVQVIRKDPARGMSEMRLASISRSLWTYSRFVSKRPVRDTYGVIETPDNSGLSPTADRQLSQNSLPIVRHLGVGRRRVGKSETHTDILPQAFRHPI